MSCIAILRLPVLTLIINCMHRARSAHTVTCQQHGTAVLSFHFPFISGPEDLDVSLIKMESIDGRPEPSVICSWYEGAEEYYADQYMNRTEIRPDLSSGKLDLILKHVKKSDEGLYKCQAANNKQHDEKMIQLYVERPIKPTEIMAAEGESVTFWADYSGPGTEVVWKIGEDKLVDVDESGPHYYRLADRASVSFHSGSLTIRNLVESDSGHYSGNILTGGKYHETKFILKVSPSKPEIHYTVTNGAITVYCESTSTGVTYEWRNSSGDLLSTGAIYTAPPETLRISDTVTCIVRNHVSECNSSVIIHYLPEGKTESNGKSRIPIIVSLVFLSVILIISSCCYRHSLRYSRKSQEYPEKSQASACEVKPLNSVNPDKPVTICDIDSIYKIKDTAENNPLYTGRERQNNVNNDVIIPMEKQEEPMRAQHNLNHKIQENVSLQEISDTGDCASTLNKSHEKTGECEEEKPGNAQGSHVGYS